MITRKIPSGSESIPVIGLGTYDTFDVSGGEPERAPLVEVMKAFSAAGGRVIDSSPMYGRAEQVVGEVLGAVGRPQMFLATKVWTKGKAEGIEQMNQSFAKMGAKTMDLMQIHNLLDVDVHTKTLLDWKSKNRIRYLGITHYTASAHGEVERQLKKEKYDFLQINYSLAERESELRLLPYCHQNKIAVIANRPFAEGAMFRRVRGKPLPPWAEEIGVASWAQYFLKWIVGHPAVTCAIPGTGSPAHIADNVAAGFGALPDERMRKRMAEYFDSL